MKEWLPALISAFAAGFSSGFLLSPFLADFGHGRGGPNVGNAYITMDATAPPHDATTEPSMITPTHNQSQ